MVAPGLVTSFRIYPHRRRSRLYVRVDIYPTLKALRAASDAESESHDFVKRSRGLQGQCVGLTVWNRRQRCLPIFAVIRLARTQLRTGVIVHECFHATCRWLRRRGVKALRTDGETQTRRTWKTEEEAASAHDALCRQLVDRLYRLKLLPS